MLQKSGKIVTSPCYNNIFLFVQCEIKRGVEKHLVFLRFIVDPFNFRRYHTQDTHKTHTKYTQQ